MFGEKLKKLRGKRTQEDIAKLCGVSRAVYSHWENGRNDPDIESVKKLAKIYNVSTDYLLGRTDNSHPLNTEEEFEKWRNDPKLDLFFKEFDQAGEEKQAALLAVWEVLKKEGKA